MEEDIKKCEALLGSERWVLGTQDKKALENLIKGYRELEGNKELKTIKGFEENIEVSKFGEWVGKNYIDYKFEYENYQRILADYIPKSKIKEKIEELNDYKSEFCQRVINHNEHTLTGFVQNILQELMEDK